MKETHRGLLGLNLVIRNQPFLNTVPRVYFSVCFVTLKTTQNKIKLVYGEFISKRLFSTAVFENKKCNIASCF